MMIRSLARRLSSSAASTARQGWANPRALLPGLALLAALLITGPHAVAAAPAPVMLRYMLWDANQRPLYQQCADDFQRSHPGIRIRIQQQGWDDYWTTLSTGLVAETAPDVFTNHLSKYPDLVANHQLVDLTPYIRRDGLDPARYEPGLYAPWGRDGRQYGLPKDWDTVALLVNLDHARAQGVTEGELRSLRWNPRDGGSFSQVVARLTRDGAGRNALQPGFDKTRVQVAGYQNPGPGGMSGQTEWASFAVSNGFRHQTRPWDAALHFDDPRLAETLAWLAGLPARGWSLAPQAVGKLGVETLFTTGRVAMVPAGAWMIGHYARHVRFAYAWLPLPIGPDGTRTSMLNGLADSIWVGTRHPEAAWAWVHHLASADCQRKLAAAGTLFPALAGLSQQTLAVFRQRGIDASAFAEMARGRTFAPPIVENAVEIDQIIGTAIENVLLGRAEAGPALRLANARARAVVRP